MVLARGYATARHRLALVFFFFFLFGFYGPFKNSLLKSSRSFIKNG